MLCGNVCAVVGEIQSITDGNATISFMKRSGKYFIWPVKPDTDTLPLSEILCSIDGEPIPVSKTRFQFANAAEIDAVLMQTLIE